jgi:hypothetical protein
MEQSIIVFMLLMMVLFYILWKSTQGNVANDELSERNANRLSKLLNQLPPLPEGQLYAAMGNKETVSGDLLGLTSQERAARVVASSQIVDEINHIIGNPYLYINREYNGKAKQKLGIHRLVILTQEDEIKLREAGYGVELVRYGNEVFAAFCRPI